MAHRLEEGPLEFFKELNTYNLLVPKAVKEKDWKNLINAGLQDIKDTSALLNPPNSS